MDAEISDVLTETSFYKAMVLAKGTVSVIDRNGTCWTRIWCIFELYHSVVDINKQGYTWDAYTALDTPITREVLDMDAFGQGQGSESEMEVLLQAVGFSTGLTAVDFDHSEGFKAGRESAFPMSLIDIGIQFKCMAAQASVAADAERIKLQIGNHSAQLDADLHGVVAAASLGRVLKEASEGSSDGMSRANQYLEAIKLGNVRSLSVDFKRIYKEEWLQRLFEAMAIVTHDAIQIKIRFPLVTTN